MTLTVKQRAKINAALCVIHDNGHNASAVTSAARSIMAGGVDPRSAYQRVLNAFADSNPTLLPELAKVIGLVEASDDATVAKYDTALSSYIQTGDDSALLALAPMIAEDMTALAARNGEQAPEFTPEFLETVQAHPVPQVEQRTATFAFTGSKPADTVAGRPIVGRAADGQAIVRTTSQVSSGGGVTGMVAPKAQREWANVAYVGPISTSNIPDASSNFAAAKEAARAAVNGGNGAGTFGKPVLTSAQSAA